MLDKDIAAGVDAFVQADAFLEGGEAKRADALEVVLAALKEKKCQLLDIVLHLGAALNDTSNPQGRREATRLLSKCLEDPIVEKSLNFKHVLTFVTFFCSKFNDWQCVEGAVTGLTTLLKMQAPQMRTLTEEDGTPIVYTVARSLFKTVHTPSHTQAVRKAILDLTLLLVTDWAHVVESMSELLGDGVISMIEEERDPRNLLLSFHISEVLLKERPERCLSEEGLSVLFEALTSYFPITFTPPKDDKYGITGEDLKAALNSALASSKRMAPLVVPFLMDSTKDVTVGDNEQIIKDALESLAGCFEAYGPEVAQKYLVEVLKGCRDQVCRTTTPCPDEFAAFLERVLRVALSDMPVAIEPAWFSKSVDPFLKGLAIEVAKKEGSLSSSGSKTLLVGAARASPLLLKKVWASLAPELVPGENGVCPRQGIRPLLDLALAAESPTGPLLEARSFKNALPGVVRTMVTMLPDQTHQEASSKDDAVEEVASKDALKTCFKLLACMCRLVGEAQSAGAFDVLLSFLFAGYAQTQGKQAELKFTGVEVPKDWLQTWVQSLAEQEDVEVRGVLLEEILSIVRKQPCRALELSGKLLTTLKEEEKKPDHPFKPIFAQLCVESILALVGHAAASAAKEEAVPDPAEASGSAEKLLTQLTSLLLPKGKDSLDMECLPSVTDALEAAAASPGKEMVVSTLAGKLGVTESPAKLCRGLDEADASTAKIVQSFLRSVLAGMPGEESGTLRSAAFSSAITAGPSALALVQPSVLPVAPAVASMAAWSEAPKLLEVACNCVSSQPSGAALELLALEALEALVIASPKDQVPVLLKSVEETFSAVLKAGTGSTAEKPEVARGAARCWAAVAGALMRRGGFANEASNFLKDLLAALEQDGAPVAPFVPMAFQVLTPPSFETSTSSSSTSRLAVGVGGSSSSSSSSSTSRQKLSPIALQQLSQTVLPQLVTAARKIGKQQVDAVSKPIDVGESSPALECAVMLLAALPIEVLIACGEDYRWCTLVGLKSLKATHSSTSSPAPLTTRAVFAAQVLQLLVRAAKKHLPWIEDDLASIIPMLTFACNSHPVPLVRLGSLQALQMIIETSQGHILSYKREIERATRKAVEDKKREVRLVAVACLNAWHCGLTMERD